MSEQAAPVAAAEPIAPAPVITPAQEPIAVDAREAANQLSKWREKQSQPPEPTAPTPAAAPAQNQALEGDDSDPQPAAPAETTEATEPEVQELPPIEPPRSWTKDEKEEFTTYPREAQEKIARREQDREAALRRSQNEAAEARKGIDAERAKVDQARQQYEAALPALLETLHTQQAGEFSDIKTMDDVTRLAREDWPRYALWDAQQKKIAAVTQELGAARVRQETEAKQQWTEFATKEDQLLLDKVPELSDKAKQQKIADSSFRVLKDIGFSEKDLASAWNGEQAISLRDHRVQLLILDAMRYREAKTTAAKPAPKAVPQVQRPGTSKSTGDSAMRDIQAIRQKLTSARGIEAARLGAELLRAQRAARG